MLDAELRSINEEALIIDEKTRTIGVPSDFLLGVESDEDVERIKFQCPKIVGDNIDLTAMRLYINYQNGNGELGQYLCTDVETSGSDITFSWLLSRNVLKYQGTVTFIVCAKKANEDGTLTNEWNTTTAQGTVLTGLEATEDVVEKNHDVIEQILAELDEIKSGGGSAANGIPAGGTTGQVLTKTSDADYDVTWQDIPSSGNGSEENGSNENLVDPEQYKNSGYFGTLFNEFGANYDVFDSEIDTTEKKILYYRVYRNNQNYNHRIAMRVACYDSSGSFLFLMDDITGDYAANFQTVSIEEGTTSEPLETVGGTKVIVKNIALVNIPENVAKVKFGLFHAGYMPPLFYPAFAVSYSQITNYGSITNNDYSLTQGGGSGGNESESNESYKPLKNKTFLMIGDSLTNWGGGGDTNDGFLKIVHDRTGVMTVNQGLAGATWEEADGQTQPGVKRVDTYVAGSVRYDCIGFLLGTNVASIGATSDTSATKTTMCGAIKYCLEKLIALSPTTPIIVFLPPQRAEGNTEQKTRNDLIKQICESYAIPTFDLFSRSQIIPNTIVDDNGTLSDGLHLSEKGQANIGRIMTSAILEVMGY